MKVGLRNRKFGWLWLGLFLIVGLIIEVMLVINEEYSANYAGIEGTIGFTRELLRSAHAHGNLLAIINILLALYIDKTAVSDALKNLASWLAIFSAVVMPIGMFGLAFGFTPAGAANVFGALAMITAVLIMGFGLPGAGSEAQ